MGSYLKVYSFVYEIRVLHTARSTFVFQEYDLELIFHFTWKKKNKYYFVNASNMYNFTVSLIIQSDSIPAQTTTRQLANLCTTKTLSV
jgi:hypothetical protein